MDNPQSKRPNNPNVYFEYWPHLHSPDYTTPGMAEDHTNAWIPVIARPKIIEWISDCPSVND